MKYFCWHRQDFIEVAFRVGTLSIFILLLHRQSYSKTSMHGEQQGFLLLASKRCHCMMMPFSIRAKKEGKKDPTE